MKKRHTFIACLCLCSLLFLPSISIADLDTGSISGQQIGNYFNKRGNTRYTVRFHQASLREVLQFLSWISDVNIIIPEGIEGEVNVSLRNVTISETINSIIKVNDLDYTVEGGIIRLGKGDVFKDSGEDLRTETFHLRYAAAKDMVPQVKSLLSERGTVFADVRTNSLIVRELPANIDNAKHFIDKVDVRDAQVLIESKIVEVTRSFSRSLGLQWGVLRGGRHAVSGLTGVGQGDSGSALNQNLAATSPTSGVRYLATNIFSSSNLEIQLSAAEAQGDAYVISDPSIVTSNGKTANIRSGTTLLINAAGDINIGGAGGAGGSSGAGLQEVETGVELNVTPQISVNNFVKLEIKTTTSTPDFSRAIDGIPVILDNVADTTVLVKDGETTIIGGLTRFSDSIQENRVPGLSKVPVVGNLFKSKSKALDNTELIVFIKPTIVRSEGTTPVQMRVRKVNQRRETMYVNPLVNHDKEKQKRLRKAKRIKKRRGNKYLK